jgi:hypothetical protein
MSEREPVRFPDRGAVPVDPRTGDALRELRERLARFEERGRDEERRGK